MPRKHHPNRLATYLDEDMAKLFDQWIEQTAFRHTSVSHALRCVLGTFLGAGMDPRTPGFGVAWQNGCVDPRKETAVKMKKQCDHFTRGGHYGEEFSG